MPGRKLLLYQNFEMSAQTEHNRQAAPLALMRHSTDRYLHSIWFSVKRQESARDIIFLYKRDSSLQLLLVYGCVEPVSRSHHMVTAVNGAPSRELYQFTATMPVEDGSSLDCLLNFCYRIWPLLPHPPQIKTSICQAQSRISERKYLQNLTS